MRFVMAAVTFVLALVLLPCQGFPGTIYLRVRPVHVQSKKPVKK
jgi:hypothetical protein